MFAAKLLATTYLKLDSYKYVFAVAKLVVSGTHVQ